MKRILVAAVLSVFVLGVGIASATPAACTVSIKLVSGESGDKFTGKVSSEKASCLKDRKVKVYLVEGAEPNPSMDTPMGTDQTNDNGKYVVKPEGGFAPPGDFYAVLKKTDKCSGDMSPVVSKESV